MSGVSTRDDWYKGFFSGAALDLWRQAKSENDTEEEVAFLQDIFVPEEFTSLLDIPCGNGRLTLPMVRAGYNVTGVDYCEEFIEEASKASKSAKLRGEVVQFVQGDMRSVVLSHQFDGAFCFGNSFGYFNREGTEQMLNTAGKCLRAGAKFVIDSIMLAETFLVQGAEREWVRVGDILMLIENRYDPRDSCVLTEYTFIRDGREESRNARHWIYTSGELCAMMSKAGFSVVDMFGSLDGEPYVLGSERMIMVAEKT